MRTYTFTKEQARQVAGGLDILIAGDLLDEHEKDTARSLAGSLRRLQGTYGWKGEEWGSLYTTEGEEELLEGVMEALWKRSRSS